MGNKIKIITDNGCDIPVEWLEKNNIHLIRFGLNIDGVEYEGETNKNISVEEFYEKIKNGAMPKTSQINPFIAREHIEPFLKDGFDVLYISFSSGLSGSCNSVKIAALELNDDYKERKVYVVDSLCASLGQGLFLDYIIKYIKEDTIIEDAYEYAESLKLNIGDEVIIKYEIIPYLVVDDRCIIKGNKPVEIPTNCPFCNEELIKDPVLKCNNS